MTWIDWALLFVAFLMGWVAKQYADLLLMRCILILTRKNLAYGLTPRPPRFDRMAFGLFLEIRNEVKDGQPLLIWTYSESRKPDASPDAKTDGQPENTNKNE